MEMSARLGNLFLEVTVQTTAAIVLVAFVVFAFLGCASRLPPGAIGLHKGEPVYITSVRIYGAS